MSTSIPKSARIYVAGHRGLVGSAILRALEKTGHTNLLTATREQLDLSDQAAVNYWFKANRPEIKPLLAYSQGYGKIKNVIVSKVREADHDHFIAL